MAEDDAHEWSITDSYMEYRRELEADINLDREVRLEVLDAAAAVEMELMAVAVFYLGGASVERQDLVERLIGSWGGTRAAIGIVETAIRLHGGDEDLLASRLSRVTRLRDLRHLIAHGRTHTWQANHPTVEGGRLVRSVYTRSRSGKFSWNAIDLADAANHAQDGRDAARELGQDLAEITRRMA